MRDVKSVPVPVFKGKWWQVAGDPDLGEFTTKEQQPADFGIWRAGDGTWQIWSCIRKTKAGKPDGKGRLFHCWEGKQLTSRNWKPMGIAMQADPSLGETAGGLQAPYVVKQGRSYFMFYGDWCNMCMAKGADGKSFTRVIQDDGTTAIFTDNPGWTNTRDACLMRDNGLWYCYYTAFPHDQGCVFCRTSKDFKQWSHSYTVAYGGEAGCGKFDAECPNVIRLKKDHYYLFRTQQYGENACTKVYYSDNPLDFGVNQDERHLVCTMQVAAPEVFKFEGQHYMAALRADLKGFQITRLDWKVE
jgi:Glycosyl hydrolases family 32 N-terminal domain